MKKTVLLVGACTLLFMLSLLFVGPLIASANNVGTNNSPATKTCLQKLQSAAQSMHISVAQLQQDQQSTITKVLAKLVKEGKMTQAQADSMQQNLADLQSCHVTTTGFPSWVNTNVLFAKLKTYEATLLNQVALGLHMSANAVMADLNNGQSLSQIAATQGITESQLHTIVLNALQKTLRQAVQAGDITQKQADSLMNAVQKHPDVVEQFLHRLHA